MIFNETKIKGAWVVDLKQIEDERGFFSRVWCEKEFAEYGITSHLSQANISFSHRAGTIRGIHYQSQPHSEMKAIRCVRGAIYDVVLDLRQDSQTYCQWHSEELTADNYRMMVVPEGCAHGFQTLADNSEVLYLVSSSYNSESDKGVRWNDSAFGICWPQPVSLISKRDKEHKDYIRKK